MGLWQALNARPRDTDRVCVCVRVCHGSQSHSRYGLLNSLFFNAISAATKTTTNIKQPQKQTQAKETTTHPAIAFLWVKAHYDGLFSKS